MNKIKFAVLLALAGAGLATSAKAQTLTYNSGDLLIGFRNTTSTANDYLVDIGSASLYTQQNGATFTLSIGDTNGALNSAFGTTGVGGWLAGNRTVWGVTGDVSATSILYAGKKETTFGTFPVSTATGNYARDLSGNQSTTASNINTTGANFNGQTASSFSSVGLIESTSNSSSWVANGVLNSGSPGVAFGQWTTGNAFESAINASTTAGHALDLFQALPNDAGTGGAPTYEGRFVIATDGSITFTSAVPEPSTLAALAGGVSLLGLIRRRRAVVA
jgi:hypothetical protein